jgi:hypothetical protein
MPTFTDGEAALSVFNKLNTAITRTERVMIVDDATQLANLVYDLNSQWGVAAGMQVITAREGFIYDVLADGASVFDIQPGAVKLEALPGEDGSFNFRSMLPAANGSTDDYPLIAKLLAKPGPGVLSIYFPNGNYYMGSTIELKRIVRLWGDSGYSTESAPRLTFAANAWGIVVNRGNTLNGGTEGVGTGGADGSEINGLYLRSNGGTDRTKHGIWMRARAVVLNTYVRSFPGSGIAVTASAGFGGSVEGNANSFFVANCSCVGNFTHGFYADGADANAGTIINLDCSANGRSGIYDSSFLGNTYIGCHTAENGLASIGGNPAGSSAMVSFGGNVYVAHWNATETQLAATQPGTNANVWIFDRAGGPFGSTVPLWVSGQSVGTYFVAFSYFSDSLSASNIILGCYSESGPPGNVFLGPTVTIGGSMSIYYAGNRIGAGSNGTLAASTMQFGGTDITTQVSDGSNFFTLSGVNPLGEIWRLKRLSNTNLRFDNGDLGSRVVYEITGPDATVPYKLSVGDFINGGVREGVRSAIPTTEFWPTGSYVRNSNVASGQPRGWRCTVGGTPGTWVADSNWP